MWNVTKRTIAGLMLGALAVGAAGCATTQAAEKDKPAPTRKEAKASKKDKVEAEAPSPQAKTEYGMCRIMRAQGKTEQAEVALVGLMSKHPEFAPAYNDLAEIQIERGKLDEAVKYLEKGLAVAPTDAVLQNNAGVCALMKHDYAAALEHFQAAAAIAPYEQRYKANVALATGLNGDTEKSKALYSEVLSGDEAEHNTTVIKGLLAPQEVTPPTD